MFEILAGFIIAIVVLVFVHELGHFLFAKWTGCQVDEFAVGFAPFIYSKQWGETTYKLGLTPIGGYVKIMGENGSEELEADPSNPRAFFNRPRWAQALVLFGGILFNMVFALLIYIGMSFGSVPVVASEHPKGEVRDVQTEILQVVEGSPIDKAGIEVGDILISIDGQDQSTAEEYREYIQTKTIEDMTLVYEQNGERMQAIVRTFQYEDEEILGFVIEDIGLIDNSVLDAIVSGLERTVFITQLIASALYDFFKALFVVDTEVLSQVSGPIGIADVAGDAFGLGSDVFINFIAVLSINLALFNLLPVPALDGGRLVFVAIESILRRPINPKWFMWVNIGGFALLIALMIVVSIWDLIKFGPEMIEWFLQIMRNIV